MLSWTWKVLKALGTSQAATERILLFIDANQAPIYYNCPNPELFCVACIFLIIKFEGEIAPNHGEFLCFVNKVVGLSFSTIREQEFELIKVLPHDFCLWPTLSDLSLALMYALNFSLPRLNEMPLHMKRVLKLYIRRTGLINVENLVVLPLVNGLVSPNYQKRRLQSLCTLLDEFGLECDLSIIEDKVIPSTAILVE